MSNDPIKLHNGQPVNPLVVAVIDQYMDRASALAKAMTHSFPAEGVEGMTLALAAASLFFIGIRKSMDVGHFQPINGKPCIECVSDLVIHTILAIAKSNGMNADGTVPERPDPDFGPLGKRGEA